jgi:Response regulator with putative antiterminator output domain
MANIIIVFPKEEEAKMVKNILLRHGYHVVGTCTTGSQALNIAETLRDGIVICGYKLIDMIYKELREYLPRNFKMLLISSPRYISDRKENNEIMYLSIPLKVYEFITAVETMEKEYTLAKNMRKNKSAPHSKSEIEIISKAKELIMFRNNMTEPQAHKYIQKYSMESGRNMIETAQMIIKIMK